MTPEHALADLKLLLLLRMFRDDGRPLVARGTLRGHGPSFFTPDGSRLITRDSIMPYTEYSSEAVFWDIGRSAAALRDGRRRRTLRAASCSPPMAGIFSARPGEEPRAVRDGLRPPPRHVRRFAGHGCGASPARWSPGPVDGPAASDPVRHSAGKSLQDYPIKRQQFLPRGVQSPRGPLVARFQGIFEVHETRPPFRRLFRLEHAGAQRSRSNPRRSAPTGGGLSAPDALWNAETGSRLRQFRVNAGLVFCSRVFGRNCPSLNGRKFGEDGRALEAAWGRRRERGRRGCRPRWC